MSFCLKSFYRFLICLQVRLVTLAYKALDDLVPLSSRPAALPSPRHSGRAGLSSCPFRPLLLHLCPLCVRARSPQLPSSSRCQFKHQLRMVVPGHLSQVATPCPPHSITSLSCFLHTAHHHLASSCFFLLASHWLLPLVEWRRHENTDLVCVVE